ncbi:MurR/RpiR family transcriptional regulator [Aeoliella sp. ICT_H6.2]|uniref:MurR/RpiR family transcriptional regulator n=1 Tax=Aeoliella straminimaris TaxID=2954799 RepID=A0A9X2FDG6_9BACT|nr:MurR/RpiR family transcriptional regulator [Aeoliella straminimaris]MCO6046188.1 MurR/RpiR family transcriptional regulator [Aeoliella straminimaris]
MTTPLKNSQAAAEGSPLADPTPWAIRFQRLRDEMTDSEQRVGAYFLEHPDSLQKSISELVEVSGLGYGTVIRFCKKLGCRGFQEFKVLMARDVIGKNTDEQSGGDPDFFQIVCDRINDDLARTARNLDRNEVERAASALRNASRVLCVGVASSAPLALSLEWKIKRLGIKSSFLSDGYVMAVEASLLSEDEVLVAVSSSGTTKDIVTAAKLARSAGATVVAITNFRKTPLVEASQIRLVTSGGRDPLIAEVPSLADGELVLTLLAECIRRLDPDVDATVLKTFDAIADRKL